MMKIGNMTALPSVYGDSNAPPHIFGTNTCLKASIGKRTDYYPTLSTFLYLQNHLHHRSSSIYIYLYSQRRHR